MNKKLNGNIRSKNKGDSLLEVLVSVVIISVALLGIAKLQATSLQNDSQAGLRLSATDLAASLAARMRANVSSDNDYVSAIAGNCDIPAQICAMIPDGDPDIVDNCSAAQVATFDLWETRCSSGVKTILPEGTMTVTCTDADLVDADACSDNSEFSIAVNWVTPQGPENVVMSFNLGSASSWI
ncbi:MAG: type IV pilus modification protein PilV [Methylococcales bacterium]|nr:type IV pilus modification protein PilV [Methylococcales bacterium]